VKRLLSALILVLVLVPLMLLMRWGGEAKGAWSEPRDGVQARLVSPRFLWRADEDVPVVVRLRNRSAVTRDVAPLSLPVRILREGHVVRQETLQLAGGPLPAAGQLDVTVRSGRLGDDGSGLYAIDGVLDGLALPAVKLRVLEPQR
jgi:hypothetical protein